jgi:hypothetical protein
MTTTYSVTRDQVILSALRKLGVVEPADTSATIDANILANSVISLNLMVKQWMTGGIKMWTVVEKTLTLVENQTSYVIGPTGPALTTDKPLKLVQAFLRNTQATPDIDIPVQLLSKQEYNVLGSKASTGVINSVFMDIGVTSSTVYVYLTPNATTAANYELHLVVQIPIGDLSSGSGVPDFPVEWMQALVWGLADQLALEYGLPLNHRQEILAKAEKYKADMEDWDIESYSTTFTPNFRAYTGTN